MVQPTGTLSFFQSKDGNIYDTYENMRRANIRYNEQRLKAIGLESVPPLTWKRSIATAAVQQRHHKPFRRKSFPTVDTGPRRSSRRVRKEPPTQAGLTEDADIDVRQMEKKTRRRCRNSDGTDSLNDADRKVLRQKLNWIDGMDDFLENVQKISDLNRRTVMRQVEKLASGKGVTYHHWEKGTYFAAGRPITIGESFSKLYEEACDFEEKHGKDLGNGWLLRHPIKKMEDYQAFLNNFRYSEIRGTP